MFGEQGQEAQALWEIAKKFYNDTLQWRNKAAALDKTTEFQFIPHVLSLTSWLAGRGLATRGAPRELGHMQGGLKGGPEWARHYGSSFRYTPHMHLTFRTCT